MSLLRIAVFLAAVVAAAPSAARECAPKLRDGWIRLTPVKMPMAAGFGRIENPCAKPFTIVGVSSAAFADTSLHETRLVEGVSRMRALPALTLQPGTTAVLQPGGMHLMLMDPARPLAEGDRIGVEFQLREGGVLRGELEVRKTAP